jgi:hypothetical protein
MNQPTLTLHDIGAAAKKSREAFRTGVNRMRRQAHEVPSVGTEIAINIHGVQFSRTPGAERTPLAKVRFDTKTKTWRQVSLAEAGLMLFYDTEPTEVHTKARVTRMIPNGRACYVEPL